MEYPLVLIADDDRDLVDLIRYTLENSGYPVTTALDGDEVLQQLMLRPPALCILDLNMPGLHGHEILVRVQEENLAPETKFIVLTGSDDPEDEGKSLELGALHYLQKPFDPLSLLDAIATTSKQ